MNEGDPTGQWPSLSDLNPVHDAEAVGNAVVTGVETGADAVSGAATAVGSFVSNHAGEIATAASLAALLIPGVDVLDLGVVAEISINGALALTANTVAVTAGGLATEQDFSNGNYLAGSLDLIGTLAELSGVHLQGIANLQEFAVREASNADVGSWLLKNAAGLAKAGRFAAVSAFGLGLLNQLFAALPAGASTCE